MYVLVVLGPFRQKVPEYQKSFFPMPQEGLFLLESLFSALSMGGWGVCLSRRELCCCIGASDLDSGPVSAVGNPEAIRAEVPRHS